MKQGGNTHKFIVGDAGLALLQQPAGSVHCVVTSPPCWGMRDYGVKGELGAERCLRGYVADLVQCCEGVRKVLRDDGTFWLNIGDSYSPDKRLRGIPWRVARALQRAGWYVRSEVMWAKRNCLPESVTDRPTKSHEQIFLLTKSPNYFYNWAATLTESAPETELRYKYRFGGPHADHLAETGQNRRAIRGNREHPTGSRLRDVWWLSIGGYRGAHFATFPVSLPMLCILAGTADRVCADCGTPHQPIIDQKRFPTRPGSDTKVACPACDGNGGVCAGCGGTGYAISKKTGKRDPHRHVTVVGVTGWRRNCRCTHKAWKPATVLDPFAGAGTTALAAAMLGRDSLSVDLNRLYKPMWRTRLQEFYDGRKSGK